MSDRVMLSAVIGGTAEALGGGKPARRSICGGGFANGAVTGAYVMMLNHLIHQEYQTQKRKSMVGKWDWQELNNNQKAQVIIDNIRDYNINGGDGDIRINDFFYNIPTGQNISIKLEGAIVDIGDVSVKVWILGSMNAKLYAAEGQNKENLWYQPGQDFFRLNYGNDKLFIDTKYRYGYGLWDYIHGRTLKNEIPIIIP